MAPFHPLMTRFLLLLSASAMLACSSPGPGPTGGGTAGGFPVVGGGFSGLGGGSSAAGGFTSAGGVAGGSAGGAAGGSVGGGTAGSAGGGTAGSAGGGTAPGGLGSSVRVGFFSQLLAAGPDGRMHLTFLEGVSERVLYGSCTQNCFTDAAFNPVVLRSNAQLNVSTVGPYGIGVDSTNRVHLLVGSVTSLSSDANAIQYGTCASNCSAASSWTWLDLSSLSPGRTLVGTTRTFMVQPNGALSFFTNEGVYFACASGCTTLSNWSAPVTLNTQVFQAVIDGTGVTHVLLTKGRTGNNEGLLGYARCTSNCTVPASWQVSATGYVTNTPFFTASLSATASGRVFIVYNQGVTQTAMQNDRKLLVASCSPTSACIDLDMWTSFSLGALDEGDWGAWIETAGEGALLASTTLSELNLRACDRDCHLAASWAGGAVIDTSAEIAQIVPPALGSSCASNPVFAAWYPRRPSIGIGSLGAVVVHNPSPLVTCPGSSSPVTRPPIGRLFSTF